MVAEAAVVGIADELTGQAVNAFVALKEGNETTEQVRKDLIMQVRKSIGPFAAPKAVFVVEDLPKTRSGKIMRRILRKILSGEEDSLGDTSTVRHATSHSSYYNTNLTSFLTPRSLILLSQLSTLPVRSKREIDECMMNMSQKSKLSQHPHPFVKLHLLTIPGLLAEAQAGI